MEKMREAFEKVKNHQTMEKMKMLVGMEVINDEESSAVNDEESSFAFMDDFNRNCTLSTTQDPVPKIWDTTYGVRVSDTGTYLNVLKWGDGVDTHAVVKVKNRKNSGLCHMLCRWADMYIFGEYDISGCSSVSCSLVYA
ncbi:hypothetical protein KSS87_000700 [Heliosperma pusillum]|nr:hypothetical protein KSS87_000700 [Heliosperma pusillum]